MVRSGLVRPQRAVAERNSFGTPGTLTVGGEDYAVHRLAEITPAGLPISLRVVLENLLRHEDGARVTTEQVESLLAWGQSWAAGTSGAAVDLSPSRVFLHDTNGVPTLVDLASMRDAAAGLGGDASRVSPVVPAELVVDHSVIADVFGRPDAYARNVEFEYARNAERYRFLKWGQGALRNFAVVPPGIGIMHQVNVEHLARVVMAENGWAFPDVCLGTDSHTTMVNGLGVLGWGIGGISEISSRYEPSAWPRSRGSGEAGGPEEPCCGQERGDCFPAGPTPADPRGCCCA